MLVHICCSVDNEYFVKSLKEIYPNEKLIGYFYDPNIHPYSEFLLRYEDVKRSARRYDMDVICAPYDIDEWFKMAKNLEDEPERGVRCLKCFEFRLENTALKALKLGEKCITTTLLMSPKKDFSQLLSSLEELKNKYNIDFVAPDFRKFGGTQKQFKLSKQEQLYHQNYCGCIYGLTQQRQKIFKETVPQLDFIPEFISPINAEILPCSIEEKINLYKLANELEEKNIKFKIIRNKFMNYRLLMGKVKCDDKVVKSYFLFGSHFKRNVVKTSIESKENIQFLDKDEIKVLDIKKLNEILKKIGLDKSYKNVSELTNNPLSIDSQQDIRKAITHNDFYDFSPIIILDEIYECKIVFETITKIFMDVREILVRI